ncbi:hypothetical protein BCL76_101359 [Streptomyces sp. CG 926]|uniref:hypothetical protein n=1 Tax=Streptomyces sp. CG 926 TaxID=1882405 RepID=UPI000D6D5D47|nr:hypothetical protein [Streptomyces sp. CG 926]PWK74625.1 hypothetical protein BCL76_101359 [Streptomyces sp. CG 926]
MTSNQTGRLIGAIFGLVFVAANAGTLPTVAAVPLRVLAVVSFVALFIALRRTRTTPAADDESMGAAAAAAAPKRFGRGYRLVVAAEVVAALAGFLVITRVLHAPQASVAWLSLVVGLHFFGLAAVWRMPSLRWLAAAMTACGAAGLVLAACGASLAVIATVAGIAPGALLLGAVWWSLRTP